MQLRKKVLSVVLVCLVILIASGAVYCFSILQGISGDRLDSSQLHINQKLDKDVSNIAVFGLDGRNDVEGDRSDTIMLVTVNYKTGNVKVTSLMRDLMVKIPETRENNVSYEKVNAAYDYGGPELAVQTLNENLDLNISDYVSIDFKWWSMPWAGLRSIFPMNLCSIGQTSTSWMTTTRSENPTRSLHRRVSRLLPESRRCPSAASATVTMTICVLNASGRSLSRLLKSFLTAIFLQISISSAGFIPMCRPLCRLRI
ncbi:hypothetical protein ELI_3271 [Eubacterium callanderi]|uniref:Cell envelope-related transcriptional attenuator domain-containing protein n=1 Tax=Eubacterium callanderi TaxID=53442 RepID=E3GFA1_9FIRM|nr:hypothetical protein ELI_3271 [Eubacterium callanderi]